MVYFHVNMHLIAVTWYFIETDHIHEWRKFGKNTEKPNAHFEEYWTQKSWMQKWVRKFQFHFILIDLMDNVQLRIKEYPKLDWKIEESITINYYISSNYYNSTFSFVL